MPWQDESAMKLPSLRRARPTELPGIAGVVRLDRRTKNLTKRLKPGEIAVIDHVDLDRVSAEALVDALCLSMSMEKDAELALEVDGMLDTLEALSLIERLPC